MADKTIFIVDDDALLASMLADHLRATLQHKVQVFHTGEACLARLAEHPDLVILDYHLNNVVRSAADGLKVLGKIKKMDKHLPVIMLSGQEQYGIALRTVQKGAEQYVLKGKDQFEEVERIVRDVLG